MLKRSAHCKRHFSYIAESRLLFDVLLIFRASLPTPVPRRFANRAHQSLETHSTTIRLAK